MKTRVSAKRWIARGLPSSFIKLIDSIAPGDKVVLACRVSGREQKRRGNDTGQEAYLRHELERRGAVVVLVYRRTVSGFDPYWLCPAIEAAKQCGAKLVALTTNRLIRPPGYHSKENPTAQARQCDLDELQWWLQGVEIVTLLDPDASPSEERSLQSKVGQWAKGRKGGRPQHDEQTALRRAVVEAMKRLPH